MATNKTYQEKKEAARQEAIDWQLWASEQNLSYGELADYARDNYGWTYGSGNGGGDLSIGWDDEDEEDNNGLSIGW